MGKWDPPDPRGLSEKGGGGINEKNLKKSEIEKCNTYSKGILAMFAHFTNLYSVAGGRKDSVYDISNFDTISPEVLIAAGCVAPDESTYLLYLRIVFILH